MADTALRRAVGARLPQIEARFEEPLRLHTSLRIGGAAEVMLFPQNARELAQALQVSALLDCRVRILGAGTNVLAPDAGVRGIVICLKDCLDGLVRTDETHIRAMAGVTMARLAVFAANEGLAGLEFAHGIPGTVGGGVYMNAGAYGGEIADVCRSVSLMDMQGTLTHIGAQEMGFAYRRSRLAAGGAIAVGAEFALTPQPPEQIRARMRDLAARRAASQPLEYPSAGSAFKRPAGGYAAALIEQAGLKGFRVGAAAISEKHAGFAINLGGATAEQMRSLLAQVSDRVFASSGVRLEPEIQIW